MDQKEILRKQRNFAIKAAIVMVLITLLCMYLLYQRTLCTEWTEGIVTSSLTCDSKDTGKYISTKYTYNYKGEMYEDCNTTYVEYEKGDNIDVYVNPNRPSSSVAEFPDSVGAQDMIFIWILLGGGFAFFAVIAIKRSVQMRKINR